VGAGERFGSRAPWRRGAWSREEVAWFLQSHRGELRRRLEVRRDARGVSAGLLDELFDEAVCSVIMMRRSVECEEHALGAFWTTVGFLLRRYREGRYTLRVGTSRPVALDEVLTLSAGGEPGPAELAELENEAARAADWLAGLSELERRVLAAMAVDGTGPVRIARLLGLGVEEVRVAARSAQLKLDQVETVADAGRMCGYRRPAILACLEGRADARQRRAARAHLRACAACRRTYAAGLRRAGCRLLPGLAGLLPGWGWLARLRERLGRALSQLADRVFTRPHLSAVAGLSGGDGALPSYLAMTLVTATMTLTSGAAPHPVGHDRRAPATANAVSVVEPRTPVPLLHITAIQRASAHHSRVQHRHVSDRRTSVLAPAATTVSRTVAPSSPPPAVRERATANAEFGFERPGGR
jgi:hypothetical protein